MQYYIYYKQYCIAYLAVRSNEPVNKLSESRENVMQITAPL